MRSKFACRSVMHFLVDSWRYVLNIEVHLILKLFSELAAGTYWWPTIRSDGLEAVEYIHVMGRDRYYIDLQKRSTDFVKGVSMLCDTFPYPRGALNGPDSHRFRALQENYSTLRPCPLHFKFHIRIKISTSETNSWKNCHSNVRISAVHHVLFRDLVLPVCDNWRLSLFVDIENAYLATLSLGRPFFSINC